jgi:hypothetical protein
MPKLAAHGRESRWKSIRRHAGESNPRGNLFGADFLYR